MEIKTDKIYLTKSIRIDADLWKAIVLQQKYDKFNFSKIVNDALESYTISTYARLQKELYDLVKKYDAIGFVLKWEQVKK